MPGTDAVWRALYARARDMRGIRARVGVLAEKGGSVTQQGSDLTLVELAAVHEFGSPAANIPERSFLRSTFRERSAKALASMVAKITKAILANKVTVKQGVNMLGAWGATEVKNTITQTEIPPPLKPATIAAKGSKRPLVDTGQLLNSITWVVEDDGKK